MKNLSITILAMFLVAACDDTPNAGTTHKEVATETVVQKTAAAYSPYIGQNFPQNVYWGDTHLHTSFSADAGLFGNRLGLDEASRFARGEEVTSSMGVPAKLQRPLDFLVVSDHAENLGLAPMIAEKIQNC